MGLRLVALTHAQTAVHRPQAVACYYLLDARQDNAIYAAVIVWVSAALMCVAFGTVFECVITTVFVSSFQDKAQFGGAHSPAESHAEGFSMHLMLDEFPRFI